MSSWQYIREEKRGKDAHFKTSFAQIIEVSLSLNFRRIAIQTGQVVSLSIDGFKLIWGWMIRQYVVEPLEHIDGLKDGDHIFLRLSSVGLNSFIRFVTTKLILTAPTMRSTVLLFICFTAVCALPPPNSPTVPTLDDFSKFAPKQDVQFPLPPTTLPSEFAWYEPDIRTQSRSPCPMLNSLANHGMLPRDGKNITADMFADALKKYLNVQWSFWWVVAQTAIQTVKPGAAAIDLHDLAMHNGIQHDAALTRNDRGQGQYFTRRNATLVQQLLKMNHGRSISYLHMARLRRLREGQSEAWNPNYSLPGQNIDSVALNKWFLAIDQAAVPLLVLSDNVPDKKENTGKVSVDRLSTFFNYERLPYENGWIPSRYELSGLQIFDGIRKVVSYYTSGPDVVRSPIGLRLTDGGPPSNSDPDY
ncbi:hypothetical protein PROFUN_06385 [Planoprotostelium fungivorum]|uniref:Heme haloperoxidase family profile domain-containing protein n=1 Tax=Planoprotostelium fungivorum TaxID=1890364 RepID=A0A2P6NNS8_9EUKA|nr:hypothetical protein PROFUN_06385 [Planoprotostelium fungivorum]